MRKTLKRQHILKPRPARLKASKGWRGNGIRKNTLRLNLLIFLSTALSITCLAAPSLSFASSTQIIEAAGFWTQAVAEGNLSHASESLSNIRLWLEGQGRFNNANPMSNMNWYQGMARAALGYAITDRLTVWAGYTYSPTENHGMGYIGEQDVWPAIRYIFPTSIGSVTLREMMESRFVRGDAPGVRSRSLIKLIHPFEFEPRLGLVLWDEAFFNLNNVTNNPLLGYSGFNQNRAFAGLSWTFDQNVRLEFGYMNQMVNKSNPNVDGSIYGSLNAISASVFMGWQ